MTKYLSISLYYRVFYNVFLPQQILIIRVESLEYPEGFDWFIWPLNAKRFCFVFSRGADPHTFSPIDQIMT